ncbi:putative secreted protein [Enterobacter sp. J49]|uniref:fimbrial protein n=1 Tax=Enterobacter sp. J49 TaxID=1903627 RepID=UPI000A36E04F|nr:fimbrial protein [Enterobacter sp. J49]OUC37007.1 putative secreted protein [Enterobacter sp. J49]
MSTGLSKSIFCALVGLAFPVPVWAQTIVTVKVTVVEPASCVINDNKTIEVDFGTVVGASVDGVKYKKAINYTLECKSQTTNAMKMAVTGNPASFDDTVLMTNITDFGIALRANGERLPVNGWFNFTYPDKPLLEAIPVKKAGSNPTGGDFRAGATLIIIYQ